ncbi:hypothetical protein GGH96_003046 [Coemansia sp. RSA 1972]|nr:hypothetical protein GGH96_003046 [Coemansia sp. RSA 1972]
MSGPPQTPIRYAPNQQYIRPGTPIQMLTPGQMPGMPGTPVQMLANGQMHTPQRPMMQYRPTMNGQTPIMNRTPQQAQAQQAQMNALQHQYMQQQMMRPNMAQARPNQPFAYTGSASMAVSGVGVNGQQAHGPLVQHRKRKDKGDEGDELDNIQPHSISLARYQNNHNLMSEIFVALPTSTIDKPTHYYENADSKGLEQTTRMLGAEMEESKREHKEAMEESKREHEEFAEFVRVLGESSAGDVRRMAQEKLDMEFVDNPYRTIERVAVDKIDATDAPVYKQL